MVHRIKVSESTVLHWVNVLLNQGVRKLNKSVLNQVFIASQCSPTPQPLSTVLLSNKKRGRSEEWENLDFAKPWFNATSQAQPFIKLLF